MARTLALLTCLLAMASSAGAYITLVKADASLAHTLSGSASPPGLLYGSCFSASRFWRASISARSVESISSRS